MKLCTNCEESVVLAKGLCQRCYDINRQTPCPNDCGNLMARGAKQCQPCLFAKRAARATEEQEQTLANKQASRRNWYYNNTEHAKTKHKEWLANNQDKVKQYEQEHTVERRAYVETRRARLKEVENTLTAADWLILLKLYDYTCVYCMEKYEDLEQDHVIPISRGGPHTMMNVVPACRPCNRKKGKGHMKVQHPMFTKIVMALYQNSTTPARP